MSVASRRGALMVTLTAVFVVAGAALAWACTPQASLDPVQPQLGSPGDVVTLSGDHFIQGDVAVYWGGAENGHEIARTQGPEITLEHTVADVEPGTHVIEAVAYREDGSVAGNARTTFASLEEGAPAVALACPDELEPAPFRDRPAIPAAHRANVDCAHQQGIVHGFGDGSFQPRSPVPRDAMASFVARTLDASDVRLPPAEEGDWFVDVSDDNAHHEAISRLAAVGIVRGGTGDLPPKHYGPARTVPRDQMATYLLRAVEYVEFGEVTGELTSTEQRFADVGEGNVHSGAVNGLVAQGLVRGVDDTRYQPGVMASRDQMATFVIRLLGVSP